MTTIRKQPTQANLKWYNVAIDYRSHCCSGCSISTIRAASIDAAIAHEIARLRKVQINLVVGNTQARLSGWNR